MIKQLLKKNWLLISLVIIIGWLPSSCSKDHELGTLPNEQLTMLPDAIRTAVEQQGIENVFGSPMWGNTLVYGENAFTVPVGRRGSTNGWELMMIATLRDDGLLNKAIIYRPKIREGFYYEYGFKLSGQLEYLMIFNDNKLTNTLIPKKTKTYKDITNESILITRSGEDDYEWDCGDIDECTVRPPYDWDSEGSGGGGGSANDWWDGNNGGDENGGGGDNSGGDYNPPHILANIMHSNSTLTANEQQQLANTLEELINRCMYQQVYSNLVGNGTMLTFEIDHSMNTPAAYNSSQKKIKFKNMSSINTDNLAEEMFHAYQDSYYNGLPTSSNNGRVDIEFEAKIFGSIDCALRQSHCGSVLESAEYIEWVLYITNDYTSIPSWEKMLERKSVWDNKNYWDFLKDFSEASVGYNYAPTYKKPDALINMLSKSSQCH